MSLTENFRGAAIGSAVTQMTVRHEGAERRPLWSPEAVPCCTGDEGRPLGAVMQVEAPNHLKLLWSKAMVVSVKEKVLLERIR